MSAHAQAGAEARVVVDWTRCDGHGVCAALAPVHVRLDEWGFPVVEAGLTLREARQVAQVCPVLALRVERDAAVRERR